MGKFVFGLILGVILVPIIVYLYFMTGMAPVATTAPPMPFEKMFARMALHARMGKEVPKTVPIQVDESNLMAGAQAYKENCAVCHGLPDGKETDIAKGMFPDPPKLMQGKGVTDDPPGPALNPKPGIQRADEPEAKPKKKSSSPGGSGGR